MPVVMVSVVLQLCAAAWSLLLLRRYRDGRLVVVPLVIGVVALEPLLRLLGVEAWREGAPETHTLLESILVLLIPFFLSRYFSSQSRELAASRRKEQLFHSLAENSLGLICQHDLDGVLLFINPAAASALGYHPKQLIGKSVREALAPAFRHEFDDYLQRIRREKSDSGMMRVITRDGRERIWLYRNIIHEESPGQPSVLGHALDVTELKAVEKQLRTIQQELETRVKDRTAELARFRAVLDQAEAAIYICDDAHRIIDVNETACRLSGYSREELLRMELADFLAGYEPLDANARQQRAAEIAKRGTVALPDHHHRRKDGSTFPVQISVTSHSVEGKTFVLAVAQDVTAQRKTQDALRQAEEELRQLFASVSDYIWSADVDSDGKVTYRHYSPVVERITGRPPKFFMAGPERWLSTIHPEDRPRLESCARRMIGEGLTESEAEYRIVLPDESVRWVRDSVTATRLDSGVTRLNGVVSDISERKDAEQERRGLEAQLRQSQRLESLGVLAGGIAHDFNNILTAILGFGSLVDADLPDDSPQKANLQEVLRAGERAKRLVQQILTFSQRSERENRPVDVAAAVSEALRLLRPSLPYNVELRQTVQPDCGEVMADFSCIQQVVLNLVTNACHAVERTGGVVEVTLKPVALDDALARRLTGLSPGPHVKLTVSDNGPGVDPALRERIFDPFFTTKEVGKGTGLGLSVVHGIVSDFRGVVELENTPGRGATFSIYLPKNQAGRASSQSKADATSGGTLHA